MQSTIKVLARLRDMGQRVSIGPFESVEKVIESQTQFSVLINRAKYTESHGNQRVVKRGHEVFQFTFVRNEWVLTDHITVWWSTDEEHQRFRSGD